MKYTARSMVKSALHHRGYRLVREDGQQQLIRELVDWHGEAMPPRLPRRDRRVELLTDVQETSLGDGADRGSRGLSVSAALYLIRNLHQALATVGDVCQFGVGQGHVAALLAHEIDGTDRTLWLYDACPASDLEETRSGAVLDLGDADVWVRDVLDRLQAIGFPPGATRIVPGRVDTELTPARLPRRVAFAYLDLPRRSSTLAALEVLHEALSQGARVIVDGYGAPTTGAQAATERFLASRSDDYELTFPLRFAGHFAILRKLA